MERNPYVGPRPFGAQDRDLFFGREREARDLVKLVAIEKVTLLYGVSGCGKTSLVNARLAPGLEEQGFTVLPAGRVGGEPPASAGQIDNIFVFNFLSGIDGGAVAPAELAHMSFNAYLDRGERPRLLALIVDQFEEIITEHPDRWQEREGFFRQLDEALAAHPGLSVVLVMRDDSVAALDPYVALVTGRLRSRFYLERMGAAGALEAIRAPAERMGRPYAPGVAEHLCDDLVQVRVPGQEQPVRGQYVELIQLQVVCSQLWQDLLPADPQAPLPPAIEAADVDRVTGGNLADYVTRALSDLYERSLARMLVLWPPPSAHEAQVRRWFSNELISEKHTRLQLLRGQGGQTGSLPSSAVDLLMVVSPLVRAEVRGGETFVELAHDRFIEPILESNRAWLARNEYPLSRAARAWSDMSRPAAMLYTGAQLKQAARQLAEQPDNFGDLEKEFVEESSRAQALRSATRTRNIAIVLLAVLFVLIGLTAWSVSSTIRAKTAMENAEVERTRAQAAAQDAALARGTAQAAYLVADAAKATLAVNVSVLLTLQAPEATPEATAAAPSAQPPPGSPTADQSSIVATVQAQLFAIQAAQTAESGAASPTTARAPATAGTPAAGGAARAPAPLPVDTATPVPTAAPTPPPNPTTGYGQSRQGVVPQPLNPSGRIVYVSSRGSEHDLYGLEPANPQRGWRDRLSYDGAWEPSYSAAANLLEYTRPRANPNPSSIFVRPFPNGAERHVTADIWDYWDASISPDGRTIAVTSSRENKDWEIYLVDLNGQVLQQLTSEDPARSWGPSWSPDGRRIAYASERNVGRGQAEIWTVNPRTLAQTRLTYGGTLSTDPAWSPNGRQIAFTSDTDGNPDIWVMDADGGNKRNLTNSAERERQPAWSPDGNWLAFVRYTPDQEIMIMRADGTDVRNVTQAPADSDWDPVWLP